ncbi:hypothetical protein NDU88_004478 [Pleurodeles waltl]|uniref:Uncharacterized protein n=1 Tax=Pleurodeles waltl TaxID=8319 RepID=A0AAV7VKI3_PLEWA|nr:hypothetical protein NDU88_004478 [Pleurodeles waltl]
MRPDATAWEEQRPGSAKRWVAKKGEYVACTRCVGQGEQSVKKGSTWEEGMSDMSFEEGELRTSGSETEWWERQGRGVSNPVRKSLQVSQAGRRSTGSSLEQRKGEQRKISSSKVATYQSISILFDIHVLFMALGSTF